MMGSTHTHSLAKTAQTSLLNCPLWLQHPKLVVTVWTYKFIQSNVALVTQSLYSVSFTYRRQSRSHFSVRILLQKHSQDSLSCLCFHVLWLSRVGSKFTCPLPFVLNLAHSYQCNYKHDSIQVFLTQPLNSSSMDPHISIPLPKTADSAFPHTDASMHINMFHEYKYSPHIDSCMCFINS